MANRLREWLRNAVDFIRYLTGNFRADGCMHSAAALTYMSLFALVPLMTVAYAMLSVVPAGEQLADQLRHWLFQNMLPETGRELEQYLFDFSQQARQLSVAGVVFLAATAYLLLKNIETTLNAIWQTHSNRRGLSSFLLYWAVLSLGPVLLAAGLAVSTYLMSTTAALDQQVGETLRIALRAVPFLLAVAMLTLVFYAVPNCRVPLRHALVGGMVAAVALELAKGILTLIAAYASYRLVYGAFAAVPLFLLWLLLTWLIILAGAELVHALGSYQYRGGQRPSLLISAVAVLEFLYRRHCHGATVAEAELTHDRWLPGGRRLAAGHWVTIREFLLEHAIIRITQDGDYVLGQDLATISLWDLARRLPSSLAGSEQRLDAGAADTPAWYRRLDDILQRQEAFTSQLAAISLAELFEPETGGPDDH